MFHRCAAPRYCPGFSHGRLSMPIRSNTPVSVAARLRAAAFACAVAGTPIIASAAPNPRPPVYTPPSKSDTQPATKPADKASDKPAATAPAGPVLAEGTVVADRLGRLEPNDKSP